MRACVQAGLRPLLRASTPTAELGLAPLPGVPLFGAGQAESLAAAAVALLAYHGRWVDYDFVMGASGAAFRVAWRADGLCCPSALHVWPAEPFERLGRAVGVVWRRRCAQAFEPALATIRRQLAVDRPVLTAGLVEPGEWSIIVGLEPLHFAPGLWREPAAPTVSVHLRTAADEAGYTTRETTPWHGFLPGPAGEQLWTATPLVWVEAPAAAVAGRTMLLETLRAAAAALAGGEAGAYVLGQGAWSAWAAGLREENDRVPPPELARQAWGVRYVADKLACARSAGARFLGLAGERLTGRETARLLALAGRELAEVAAVLRQLAELLPEDDTERCRAFCEPALRETAARLLETCRRRDRTGLGYLHRALARLG